MSEFREPVRREVFLDASADQVWAALTRPPQLSAWFGAEAEIDPRLGGSIRFLFPDGSQRRGIINEFEAPWRLGFRWRATSVPGESSVVVLALEEVRGGTRLVVSEVRGIVSPRSSLEALAQ